MPLEVAFSNSANKGMKSRQTIPFTGTLKLVRLEHIGDLDVFVQIVERGSFTDAARNLGATKNAVTRRLARLEHQLGKQLLHRTSRRVSLTEDGRRFILYCRRILSEVALAEDAVAERDTLRGTIRVGAPTQLLLGQSLAPVGEFLAQHPHLELQVISSDQPFDLAKQGIDVAIAVGPQPDSVHLRRRITNFTEMVLAASPEYVERHGRPTSPHDLKHHTCLKFQTDAVQPQWPLIDARGRDHEVPVGGGFSSNDSRVLESAMFAGLGIGIAAKSVLRAAKAAGTLVPILPRHRFGAFPVSLLYRRETARTRRVQLTLAMLGEVVRTSLG